jgi:hypothetical protein
MSKVKKVYLEKAVVLKVFDGNEPHAEQIEDILWGHDVQDDTCRFLRATRVITSPIVERSDTILEYFTRSGSCYVVDESPEDFGISVME